MARAEGRDFTIEMKDVSAIKSSLLETFSFDSVDQIIKIETNEFSAVCPFSGLPDIAKVKIAYRPRERKCLELKALKYYFMSFRNVGLYQEGVTARIFNDLAVVLNLFASDLFVQTTYNTRGGLDVVCSEGSLKA